MQQRHWNCGNQSDKTCDPGWLLLKEPMMRNLHRNVGGRINALLNSVGHIHADFCRRKWMWSNSLHTERTQTDSHPARFKNPGTCISIILYPRSQSPGLPLTDGRPQLFSRQLNGNKWSLRSLRGSLEKDHRSYVIASDTARYLSRDFLDHFFHHHVINFFFSLPGNQLNTGHHGFC